jgi:hypothetical protein
MENEMSIIKCNVSDCNNKRHAKGLCSKHYTEQWRKESDIGRFKTVPIIPECNIASCNEKSYAKEMCKTHYKEHYKQMDSNPDMCWVENCEKSVRRNGLCDMHSTRAATYGGVELPIVAQNKDLPCNVNECKNTVLADGLCSSHYQIKSRTGSTVRTRPIYGNGSITKSGYRIMSVPNRGQVFEHRLLVEDILCRQLLSNENVHHRNGDRLDNSCGPCVFGCECRCSDGPHNLELWSKEQPCGQRIKDKLEYAYYIIKLYGDIQEE